MALPAIPWLRGLAKAVRGEQVGSVLQNIAAKFKLVCEAFRDKKRLGSLRSSSHASWAQTRSSSMTSLKRNSSQVTTEEERNRRSMMNKGHLHTKEDDMRGRRRSSIASINITAIKRSNSLLLGNLDGSFNASPRNSISAGSAKGGSLTPK